MRISREEYYRVMAKAVLRGYWAGLKDGLKWRKKRVKTCCE